MGKVRGLVAATTSSVVIAAALAGCGSGGSSTGASSTASSASSSSSAASSPSAAAPSAPAGTVYTTAKRAGIRFAVPKDWKVFDLVTVLEKGDQSTIDAIAKQMNISTTQFKQMASNTDVAVFGPVQGSFAPNINVQTVPAEAVPSENEMSQGLKAVGAEIVDSKEIATAVGAGRLTTYRLTIGSTKVEGRQVAVKAPGGVAIITVSHTSSEQAGVLAAMVQSSLAKS